MVREPNLQHHFLVAVAGYDSSGPPVSPLVAPGSSSAVEKVVDGDILQQGQEHEEEAYDHIDVDGLNTGHLGEFIPQMRVDGVQDEHRRQT